MLKIMTIVAFFFQLVGCASVLNDSKQVVNVQTLCSNVSIPATCVAENSKGKWRFNTPQKVLVDNDIYGLKITCKSSYSPIHAVEASARPDWSFAGNILVGGIVGAAVDVVNASGFKYPSDIDIINPSCK